MFDIEAAEQRAKQRKEPQAHVPAHARICETCHQNPPTTSFDLRAFGLCYHCGKIIAGEHMYPITIKTRSTEDVLCELLTEACKELRRLERIVILSREP